MRGIDYYRRDERGCCLLCDSRYVRRDMDGWNGREEGCLCYECKCKKCDNYEDFGGYGGACRIAQSAKKEAEERNEEFWDWVDSTKSWVKKKVMSKAKDSLSKGELKFSVKYNQLKFFEDKLGKKRAKEVMAE